MKLAHSAPSPGREPQGYAEHAGNVRAASDYFAEAITPFADSKSGWSSWRPSIPVAGEWHDLGKLDAENQVALKAGRGTQLKQDHVDAGVAYALAGNDLASAWLIRSHHAPGLPAAVQEEVRETYKLRGYRHGGEDNETHRPLVERNNAQLDNLILQHRECLGESSLLCRPSLPQHGMAARMALSCLVDADHSDTARFDEYGAGKFSKPDVDNLRWSERLDALRKYISEKNKHSTAGESRNQLRQQLFDHCAGSDSELQALSVCEAPVGLGKTTAVLAYLLRHAIAANLRRIIIVAPYTNILTQTAATVRAALALENENPEMLVLEHHHRAEFENPALRGLSVNWDAPIILTTAVQFFETLASNNPASLRKLNHVPGSGIFIDESHATLPMPLWPQCFEWLRELATHWSCPTVLASGSSVRFWQHSWGRPPGSSALHLPDITPEEITRFASEQERLRIEINELPKPLNAVNLVNAVQEDLDQRRSVLLIVNTVLSAAGLARLLAQRFNEEKFSAAHLSERRILHLSTALTPAHRERVLEEIDHRMKQAENAPWVLVATSCVEAGVDLDFQSGLREDASMMSFLQTGGRINRHHRPTAGTLTRFQIATDPHLSPHPELTGSAEIFRNLFNELKTGTHRLSDISTAAAAREVKSRTNGNPGQELCNAEHDHDYPEVARLCRVISNETVMVVVDPELISSIRAGVHVPPRNLLRGSVQLWGQRAARLGLEPLHPSGSITELYAASESSYDHSLIGIGKALLDEKLSATANPLIP